MLDDVSQNVRQIKVISAHDEEVILAWNQHMPKTVSRCVHELVQDMAYLFPSDPAVCAWDGTVTYQELDELSSRLAHHLVKMHQVGPEIFVPFCFEKSVWATVALVAVMKAGGACVPLDPGYPNSRLRAILGKFESSVALVSASVHTSAVLSDLVATTLVVHQETLASLENGVGKACATVRPHHPVYAIFTSGSTGVPNGVVWEHSALSTSLVEHGRAHRVSKKSRTLNFASYVFDQSVSDIFATLICGACVFVPSDYDRFNNIESYISREQVTWAHLTPTLARVVKPESVPSIQTLVLGGEAIGKDNIATWVDHVQLLNGYGPAECCICCCLSSITGPAADNTNIGKAVGGLIWLTDPSNPDRLVPIGAVGEMLVEGPILARAYLNDSSKTRSAFIYDPWWTRSASTLSPRRFYRTGDLARYNPDGSISFISRRDGLVKVRGQRLELTEVEYHLMQFPSIQHASVLYPKAGPYTNQLVAIVTLQDQNTEEESEALQINSSTDKQQLQSLIMAVEGAIASHVPSHGVPSVWISVNAFPRTMSGKLDRMKILEWITVLPPDVVQLIADLSAHNAFEDPKNLVEERLQRLWCEILSVPPGHVGRRSSFFRLGGDSVNVMQLVAKARSEGIVLSVSDVFRHQQLHDLAAIATVDDNVQDEVDPAPFTLVGGGIDISTLCNQIATDIGVDIGSIEDIYPATPLQEGLMVLTGKQPGAYTGQSILELPPDTDIVRYRSAWQQVADANPILRTRIVNTTSNGTLQVVLRGNLHWQEVDGMDSGLQNARSMTFNFGDPLVRLILVKNQVILTLHHSLYDGWALPTVFADIKQAYETGSVALRPSFSRFVRYLAQVDTLAAETYWSNKLSGSSAVPYPTLPNPRYEPTASTSLTRAITFSRLPQSGIGTSTIIRAAWGLVLSKYTGSIDVSFGGLSSGRYAPIARVEEIVGPTIAAVPIRMVIDNELTVLEFLLKIQTQMTDMIPWEQYGLQRIKRIGPELQTACNFHSLLVIHPTPPTSEQADLDVAKSLDKSFRDFRTYALTLSCSLTSTGALVNGVFDPAVVGPIQLKRILGFFETICQVLALGDTATRICDVGLITDSDRAEIEQRNTAPPPALNRTVHGLFEEQAANQPTAPAVCSWDGDFTYEELDHWANRLAHHLVERGVGPEIFVAVCIEKSRWAVVAILAILKAGGACVPLDPAYPVERLRRILLLADVHIAVVSKEQESKLKNIVDETVLVSQSSLDCLRDIPRSACADISPTNAAYVIFTSGTTDIPKGVVWEHNTLSTSLKEHGAALKVRQETRILQFAAYAFDVSVSDIGVAWVYGSCICIPSEHDRMNNITHAIQSTNANWAHLTPTFARLLKPSEVSQLKTLALGGEAIGQDNVEKWAGRLQLMIAYGPTETCIDCCGYEAVPGKARAENLGYAVGCLMWLVIPGDPDRLAPIGAVGEIVIEGAILARGYLNDPEKTSKAFILNPKWTQKGKRVGDSPRRLYRTGDLGRYNSDGTISFATRSDGQIKRRGQRLELSEVEYHLTQSALVGHTVAAFPKDGSFKGHLVVVLTLEQYKVEGRSRRPLALCAKADKTATIQQIQVVEKYLSERIPAHGIPSVWIAIEEIPRTTSGKVDRLMIKRWISEMDQDEASFIMRALSEVSIEEPTTATEEHLRMIWAQVLNVSTKNIGRGTSFLRLGGDSIAAIQVVSRCRGIGLTVSVQEVLRSKTLEELGSKARQSAAHVQGLTEIDGQSFALSPIQRMHMERCSTGTEPFFQSLLLQLRPNQPIDVGELSAAIAALVDHHSMLRARFLRADDGSWTQVITADTMASFHCGSHDVKQMPEVKPIVETIHGQLNIEHGPLIGAGLLNIEEHDRQVLFLAAHHLVVDLVSWRVILHDLEQILKHKTFNALKTMSFQAWTRLQGAHVKQELRRDRVLPFDIPRANYEYWGMAGRPNLERDIRQQVFALDGKTSALLLSSAADSALRAEPVDLFLSAILFSFADTFPDRGAPAIFNEGHGREPWDPSIDISRTVGWFSTVYPLWVSVESHNVRDIVRAVKDARRSIPQNGWPYFSARYLADWGSEYDSHFPMELQFNFTGSYQQLERADALFDFFQAESGDLMPPTSDLPRFPLFAIGAGVNHGILHFSFTWNRLMKHQDRICSWVIRCQETLTSMPGVLATADKVFTKSDFPLLQASYGDLETVQTQIMPALGLSDRNSIQDIYPVTPMQEGILMARTTAPDLYHVYEIARLSTTDGGGSIDTTRLLAAWRSTVRRHTSLRTVFIELSTQDGVFQQVVLSEHEPSTSILDPRADFESSIAALKHHEALIHDQASPPHRLCVCQAADGSTYCRLDISHALIDGESMHLLWRDLCLAYDSLLPPGPGPLYGDYVSFIQQQPAEDALQYWGEYLDGLEPCHFPELNGNPSARNATGTAQISFSQVPRLRTFCEEHHFTASNLFHAAWSLLLQAYTGSASTCFGYGVSGRDAPIADAHDMVGVLINLQVCRVEHSPQKRLLSLVQQAQNDHLNSLSYRPISLALIQHTLHLGKQQLFNTAISLQTASQHGGNAPRNDTQYAVLEGADPSEVCLLPEVWRGSVQNMLILDSMVSCYTSVMLLTRLISLSSIDNLYSMQPMQIA